MILACEADWLIQIGHVIGDFKLTFSSIGSFLVLKNNREVSFNHLGRFDPMQTCCIFITDPTLLISTSSRANSWATEEFPSLPPSLTDNI